MALEHMQLLARGADIVQHDGLVGGTGEEKVVGGGAEGDGHDFGVVGLQGEGGLGGGAGVPEHEHFVVADGSEDVVVGAMPIDVLELLLEICT